MNTAFTSRATMDYEAVVSITQSAALVFFMVMFAIVVAYVFWPANREKFARAARVPLEPGEKLDENKKG